MGVSVEDVVDIKNVIYNSSCFSLDLNLNDEEDKNQLIDMVADEKTTEDIFFNEELRGILLDCLDGLREQEIEIIKYRFGFYGNKTYTLEEVGKKYGVTRERIRQIEANVLRKLRNPAKRKKFEGYI